MADIYIAQISDKITPFVEKYLDNKYPDGFEDMPNMDEMVKIAADVNSQLLLKHPDLENVLDYNVGNPEAQIAYYGCGCILWGILAGAIFCRCGRRRCRRGYRCRRRGFGCRGFW